MKEFEKVKREKEEAVLNQRFENAAKLRDKEMELGEKYEKKKLNGKISIVNL